MKQPLRLFFITLAILFYHYNGYSQYATGFEDDTKTAYASGTVTLSSIDWDMTQALIGTSASDYKVDNQSTRIRGFSTSSISMLEDVSGGIGTISFSHRRYGTDSQVSYIVEYSTNSGTNWTQIGSTFTPSASVGTFSATVNVAGNYRIRIRHNSGGNSSTDRRANFDNIDITGYALPVELFTFILQKKGFGNFLSWQTASELNNSHFSIERSTDGLNFREIGIVQGNGTTTEPQHYKFVDESPAKGTNYYRLKQMDFDGKFEYSKVVSVNFGTGSHAMLYPTLASSVVNLKFTEPIAEDGNITLYDINGRLVGKHDIEPETEQMEIIVENLQPGHYFAKIQIGRQFENLRFVKQ